MRSATLLAASAVVQGHCHLGLTCLDGEDCLEVSSLLAVHVQTSNSHVLDAGSPISDQIVLEQLEMVEDQVINLHEAIEARLDTMLDSDECDPSSGANQCCDCFPEEGARSHLRSPCGRDPSTIPLPNMVDQQTANCPFLGTLTNEGVIANDWIINETLWKAASFGAAGTTPLHNVQGAFQGNFRDHSRWKDEMKVQDQKGAEVQCVYWYLNPLKMEGMSNEHKSSTGISDCPTDWSKCKFKCGSAGEWQCDTQEAACSANLPNEAKFDAFIKKLIGFDVIDEDAYVTTCQLEMFRRDADVAHDEEEEEGLIHDFHFHSHIQHDCSHAGRTITVNGKTLTQTSNGISGGQIGGSISGGYKDLVQYFGQPSSTCANGFQIQVKDLRRIDLERKFPCSFDRTALFAWVQDQNPLVTDRRVADSEWMDGC